MTSITLRPRRPLESLPLAQYTTLAFPPSPVSLPSKRSLTSSPNRQGESSTSKARKVSAEHGGVETIRRKRSDLGVEAKAALSRDDFGTGKSPARRLFVDDKTSFGISGATLSAPTSPGPSRRLDFSTTPTDSPGPSNTLAPSPPISSAPTPSEHENGATVNIHDIGFDIHPDNAPHNNLATPDSKPYRKSKAIAATPAADALSHVPSSPVPQVVEDHNDQENVPPPQQTPSRSSRASSTTRSPLSKSSISGSSSSARFLDDTGIVQLTGSGRNRIREKSKLNEVLRHAGSDDAEDELTPGRTRPADKGKGKARLSLEVNCL